MDAQQRKEASTNESPKAGELTVQKLEERISPRLATNHNESLLVDC